MTKRVKFYFHKLRSVTTGRYVVESVKHIGNNNVYLLFLTFNKQNN